jgi:hypothetical protein
MTAMIWLTVEETLNPCPLVGDPMLIPTGVAMDAPWEEVVRALALFAADAAAACPCPSTARANRRGKYQKTLRKKVQRVRQLHPLHKVQLGTIAAA